MKYGLPKTKTVKGVALPFIKLIRHGQVTLPAKFRKSLNLKDGDYLEAELLEDRIVLKPTVVMGRQEAIKGLHQLMDEIQAQNEDYSDEEVMENVMEAIKHVRRKKRHD